MKSLVIPGERCIFFPHILCNMGFKRGLKNTLNMVNFSFSCIMKCEVQDGGKENSICNQAAGGMFITLPAARSIIT